MLDVGTGSGYQAAVLAELAAEVVTIERVPELAERARERLSRSAGYDNVEVRVGDGSLGVPDRAPFDGIAVAAAAPAIPPALYEQLAEGGRLVLPRGGRWGQDLVLVERTRGRPRRAHLGPVPLRPARRRRRFRRNLTCRGVASMGRPTTLRRLWRPLQS